MIARRFERKVESCLVVGELIIKLHTACHAKINVHFKIPFQVLLERSIQAQALVMFNVGNTRLEFTDLIRKLIRVPY